MPLRPRPARLVALLLLLFAGLAGAATPIAHEPAGSAPKHHSAAGTAIGMPAAVDAPNVVVIVADDLDTATWEHALPHLPHLRNLAEQGATATNFIVTTPLCCPSRVTMLRGQYAHNHGVLDNVEPIGGFVAMHRSGGESSTLATWLDDAGYQTALMGKYLNRYPVGAGPAYVPPGWDEWVVPVVKSGKKDTHEKFGYALDVNGTLVRHGDGPADYVTDVLAARATGFIDRASRADVPFFLVLAPTTPHGPFDPAPRHRDAFAAAAVPRAPSFDEADVGDKPAWVRSLPRFTPDQTALIDATARQRLAMMRSLDDLVGGVVGALRDAGELDTTYVVFVSDNGFHLGEHRFWAKRTPYEESIRVPLVVRGPAVAAGTVVDELTLTTDLAPTVAEWANVDPPGFVDGRSLATLLSGASTTRWRVSALVEVFPLGTKTVLRQTASPVPVAPAPTDEAEAADEIKPADVVAPAFRALRAAGWVYIEYETGERELYDLTVDPFQQENLAEHVPAETLRTLSAHLAALADCRAADCRAAEDAPLPVEPFGRASAPSP